MNTLRKGLLSAGAALTGFLLAFTARPAQARDHRLVVPDDPFGSDVENFDEDTPLPGDAELKALAAKPDLRVSWDASSRTLDVVFLLGTSEWPAPARHATRTRIHWGARSVETLEVFSRNNAERTAAMSVCPCEFLGWSETLGLVYQTRDIPRGIATRNGFEMRMVRFFDRHHDWTDPAIAGRTTPWKSVAPALERAVKARAPAAARAALGGRPRPEFGEPARLLLQIEYLEHPIPDVKPLLDEAARAKTPAERVASLQRLREYRASLEPLARLEGDAFDGHPPSGGWESLPAMKPRKAADDAIARESKELGRDLADRARAAHDAGRFGEERAWIAVAGQRLPCDPGARALAAAAEKAFLWSTFGNTNPDYYNVTLIKGEVKGIKPKLRLVFSGMSTDELALRTVMIEVPDAGAGTWVDDPDVPARLAEFESAKRELASIDDELAALDAGPLGTTVLGDRGVEVHEIFVDADSREHDTVAYASPQNVYRIGVGKDAKNRAALRAELKSRRTLLASIVAAGPRTKRYVPGSGTVKKVPVECGAIPGQVSVIAIKGEEKFEAGGKFSFDVPCTPGAASDVNRYAKDVRSDYENEAARAAAAKALAGDPDGAWSVFWLGQGPRPDDEIGKLLDGSPLCTKETKR